jgi:hypothetical protein
LNDYKGTYPPLWYPDNLVDNGWTGDPGNNESFMTLLGRYLGAPTADPHRDISLGVFQCPSDVLPRDSYLLQGGAGIASYTMPQSYGADHLLYNIRVLPPGTPPSRGPVSGQTLNRGIGQCFGVIAGSGTSTDVPMWIKVNMPHPSAKVLLLVERAYTEQVQSAEWELGLECERPGSQLWPDPTDPAHGTPLLHSNAHQINTSPVAKFNYLFCDYHVDFLAPADTVREQDTVWYAENVPAGANWWGGDYSWTILPDQYFGH